MPDEPEQTQIPSARASTRKGSLPQLGITGIVDDVKCMGLDRARDSACFLLKFHPVPGSGRMTAPLILYHIDSMPGGSSGKIGAKCVALLWPVTSRSVT